MIKLLLAIGGPSTDAETYAQGIERKDSQRSWWPFPNFWRSALDPIINLIRPRRELTKMKPVLVAEVTLAEITPDGSLRHPSFQRLREDKEASTWRRPRNGRVSSVAPVSLVKVAEAVAARQQTLSTALEKIEAMR